jgi:hypothetical protein
MNGDFDYTHGHTHMFSVTPSVMFAVFYYKFKKVLHVRAEPVTGRCP